MTGIDWAILATVYGLLVGGVWISKRYMRSVADFWQRGARRGATC